MIVGAHALAAHGHVRATTVLDLWIRPDEKNAHRVMSALSEFGVPLGDLTADLSKAIEGVAFADAWPDRVETVFGGQPAFVISRHHLITNKKTAARLQDLADVQQLETFEDQR